MYKSDSFYIYDSVVKFDPALVSCWQVTCGDGYSYTKTQKMIDAEPKDMLCAVRHARRRRKNHHRRRDFQFAQRQFADPCK